MLKSVRALRTDSENEEVESKKWEFVSEEK